MNPYFYAKELKEPIDVQPYLAEEHHWKPGFSACELATSWIRAGDIPSSVRAVLDQGDTYRGCRLVEGFFERQVDLRTPGRPSQTDLLALVLLRDGGYAVIAVEGKVKETFGPVVGDWETSDGKTRRLASLCALLELQEAEAQPLRYQLLHRAASALYEAERYGAGHAMLLVHSFDPDDASLNDFRAFASALGLDGAGPGCLSSTKRLHERDLSVAWVSDRRPA
jgi:hypothetical protein